MTRSSLSGNLWCRVTGQKYGYLDQSVDTDPSQVLSDLPTFSGSLQVDQTLTADAGYGPDDASLTYQWRANGTDIAGATELTFTLRPSDVGKRITFAVTGVRTGFATKTKVAANTSPVALAQQVNTPLPTVSGTFRVGQTLTATVGSWDYGVSLSYRWLRSGSPIPGESGTSYTLGMADNGKQIAFKVTSTKSGYVSVVRYSVNTSVSYLQHQVITSTPVITGSPVYGETLTVNVGSWDIDASLDWIWTRNGVPVPDTARQTTYQIGLQDLGKRITVKLIATEAGYFDESRVSNSTALIGPRRFSQVGVPVVSGIAAVGETLTVDPGTWDQAANLTIEWCRNGQPIPGATQTTYVLTSQDAKTRVTARVTASAVAYITVVAGSGKSGAVSR